MKQIIEPTVAALAAQGTPYVGFLYAGLMISPEGEPKVLEFNCRLGDPETQPLMLRLQSDLIELCLAALRGQLHSEKASWDPRPALAVVMAAGGYPVTCRKGDVISGLNAIAKTEVKVFHSGTLQRGQDIVTNGGRVLTVTALGDNLKQAQHNAYECVKTISWPHGYYRTDIGYRAMSLLPNSTMLDGTR